MLSGNGFCKLCFNISLFLKELLKGQDCAISLKNDLTFTLDSHSHLINSEFIAGSLLLHLVTKLVENSLVLLNESFDLVSLGGIIGIVRCDSFLNISSGLVILGTELTVEVFVHGLKGFIKLSAHAVDHKAMLIVTDFDLLADFAHLISVLIQGSCQFGIGFCFMILALSLQSSNCCFMSILSTIHLSFMSLLVSVS